MDDRIGQFFDHYQAAYARRDAAAIAELFAYPSHVTSDAGEVVLVANPSPEGWRPRLERLLAMYDAIGVAEARVLELEARQLSPRIWLAEVRWALHDAAGSLLYDFHTVYVLAEIAGALRIGSAVSPDELPRYQACKARLERQHPPAARSSG
jgi:hypothetical protein